MIKSSYKSFSFKLVMFSISIQYLAPALLMIPQLQSYRIPIRMLPYAVNIAMLLLVSRKSRSWREPNWNKWIWGAWIILFANLVHPGTYIKSGAAQFVFQMCIMASTFWGSKAISTKQHLRTLLWVVLTVNALSAIVGMLQVYFPKQFPTTISKQLAASYVQSLQYQSSESGKVIIRPAGLTDLPGGAALGGSIAALLGIYFALEKKQKKRYRVFCLAAAAIGLFALYLTQIRVYFVSIIISFLVMILLNFIRGRIAENVWIGTLCFLVIVSSFVWAQSVGGMKVTDRFLNIKSEGVLKSYEEARWHFVVYTFTELLVQYPFGIGLGNWGMMCDYFGLRYLQRHAEIQITGWLYDGGILLWFFYGAAIISAMTYIYGIAIKSKDNQLAFLAKGIYCINVFILSNTMASPTFNYILGSNFWLFCGVLYAAHKGEELKARMEARAEKEALGDHAKNDQKK